MKRWLRPKGTETDSEALKHCHFSSLADRQREKGYEEGWFRGAFSICGIWTDRRVYSKRREFSLSAFSLFRKWRKDFRHVGGWARVFYRRRLIAPLPPSPPDSRQNSRAHGLTEASGFTIRLVWDPETSQMMETTAQIFASFRHQAWVTSQAPKWPNHHLWSQEQSDV